MNFVTRAASVLLLAVLCATSLFASPPAKYDVGTLVFTTFDTTPSHLIQFPGSPVDCTDTFSSDWCMWTTCDTISTSTYNCENTPMVFTCLAFQISGGQIKKIINVDSDGCK